jgi:hypothetical protein
MRKRPFPRDVPVRAVVDASAGGSVVFPVHNESFIIEAVLRNYIAELQGRIADLEVIVGTDPPTGGRLSLQHHLTGMDGRLAGADSGRMGAARIEIPVSIYSGAEQSSGQSARSGARFVLHSVPRPLTTGDAEATLPGR